MPPLIIRKGALPKLFIVFTIMMAFVLHTFDIQTYLQHRVLGKPENLSVQLVANKTYLVSGVVGMNDCERVSTKIKDYTATVILDSPGGSFVEGLCIAENFKKRNIHTIVTAKPYTIDDKIVYEPTKKSLCASACTYMFLGGHTRELIGDAKFGIHNPGLPREYIRFLDRKEIEYTTFTTADKLARSLNTLGLKGEDVRRLFFVIPNESIFWLTPKYFTKHPQFKTIATIYNDFFGYTGKVE